MKGIVLAGGMATRLSPASRATTSDLVIWSSTSTASAVAYTRANRRRPIPSPWGCMTIGAAGREECTGGDRWEQEEVALLCARMRCPVGSRPVSASLPHPPGRAHGSIGV